MSLLDTFSNFIKNLSSPADSFEVPAANTDLSKGLCRSVYVGEAGDVIFLDKNDVQYTHYAAAAGTVLPIRAVQFKSGGVDVTKLLAYY